MTEVDCFDDEHQYASLGLKSEGGLTMEVSDLFNEGLFSIMLECVPDRLREPIAKITVAFNGLLEEAVMFRQIALDAGYEYDDAQEAWVKKEADGASTH